MEILGRTSTETYNAIWFGYDGFEWGINENFNPNTLMCDGDKCDNNADSRDIAELIKNKVEIFGGVNMIPWI